MPIEEMNVMWSDYDPKNKDQGNSEEKFPNLELDNLMLTSNACAFYDTQVSQLLDVLDVVDKEQEELEIYKKEQEYKLSDIEFQALTTSQLLSRDVYDNLNYKLNYKPCNAQEQLQLAKKIFREKQKIVLPEEKILQFYANIEVLREYNVEINSKIDFALYRSCFEDYVEKYTTQKGINQIDEAFLEFINHCDKQILIRQKNNQPVPTSDNTHTYGASMYSFGATHVYKEVILTRKIRGLTRKIGGLSSNIQSYISIRYYILNSCNARDNDIAYKYLQGETKKIMDCAEVLDYVAKYKDNNLKQYIIKRFHILNLNQLNKGSKRKRSDSDT